MRAFHHDYRPLKGVDLFRCLWINRTIVIDVGKDFRGAALEWFPKHGMRRIDAILLTHDHADGTFLS